MWSTFNTSLSGKLILNTPLAIACYPGPQQDATACAAIDTQWSNASFQSNYPVGLSYPVDLSCPPVNASAGETPGTCSIGDLPRYTVNATEPEDVAAAILFAKKHNIRLVIKDTGHDILGRYGRSCTTKVVQADKILGRVAMAAWKSGFAISGQESLSKSGTTLHMAAQSRIGRVAHSLLEVATRGATFIPKLKARTWSWLVAELQYDHPIFLFSINPDDSKTVGCLGGWMQGGGHGPASHDYGLGADQVLEATVVLANGSIVTASPCENADLFFAIRGGGGGTYGVVVSTTIKAHPNNNIVTQHVAVATLTANNSALFDAIATIWAAYPDLNDAGYSGYGQWAVDFPVPLFANVTTGFVHGISMFGKSLEVAQAAFSPTAEKLKLFNGTSLFVSITYTSYPTYWDFYRHESGVEPPVGYPSALGSRLFDRAALTGNAAGLKAMLKTIAGTPGQGASSNFELVSGGRVFEDASDPYSGVNPAWRTSYMNNIVALALAPQSNASMITAAYNDITNIKVAAMNEQAPNTGVYMNEVRSC